MSIKSLRWIFVGLLIGDLVVMLFSSPQTVGISATLSAESYRFAGGTRPWFLVLAILVVVAYFALMNTAAVEAGSPVPGAVRRFAAFWLDFLLLMMAIAPVIGIVSVVLEWRRTGIFAWTFERDTPSAFDTLLAIGGGVVSFVALFFYHLFALIRRRPSPGACIAGYQVLCDEGKSLSFEDAAIRIFLGMFGVAGWFVTVFVGRQQKKGKLWFDRVSHTRAVRL